MTEIDDLGQLFGHQPRLTPAQQAHMERVLEFEKRLLLERIETVQFLAPILCTCAPYYDRWAGHPPQMECPVHSIMMAHPYTGQPIMPGMAPSPGTFTPAPGKEPGGRNDHDEERTIHHRGTGGDRRHAG